MKIIYAFLIAFLLLTVFTFSECKKNVIVPQLPPETQNGANTVGCKLNGNILLKKGIGNCRSYEVQYYRADSLLAIHINNGCGEGYSIFLRSVFEQRDYVIFNPTYNSFYYRNSQSTCSPYDRSNSVETGVVTITKFDLTNKIVSGHFYGEVKKNGCPDLNFTEGRFDFMMAVFN